MAIYKIKRFTKIQSKSYTDHNLLANKVKVYDKASWHIDAGEPVNNVLTHFKFIMNWCNKNNLLSDEGKEVLEFGIDKSISIHSRLLNERGN